MATYAAQRERMVAEVEAMYAETAAETGLQAMTAAVAAAVGRVEVNRLIAPDEVSGADGTSPLPIGAGQTISQPYIVALSTDLIEPRAGQVVLEVGTGSGYQAAILAEIVAKVYSIEVVPELGRGAAERLAGLGYTNVEVRIGDGYAGWPEQAPFDAIVVTAAAPQVPPALIDQLKPGGRMVIPVGERWGAQDLMRVEKHADGRGERKSVLPVRFVPLVHGA